MKRTILTISLLSLIALSCGTDSKKASDQEEGITPTESGSIQDTISANIEETKKEIEESAEKLDELMKDL